MRGLDFLKLVCYTNKIMSRNVVIAGVVIIVLIVAGWFFMSSKKSSVTQVPSEVTQTPAPTESPTSFASDAAMMNEKNIVKMTSSNFSPKNITVKVGESVIWQNDDSANHTVNSYNHPTHTLYPFLNLGLIKSGETKSATFSKTGTFMYHDHLNPSLTGTVTVE